MSSCGGMDGDVSVGGGMEGDGSMCVDTECGLEGDESMCGGTECGVEGDASMCGVRNVVWMVRGNYERVTT